VEKGFLFEVDSSVTAVMIDMLFKSDVRTLPDMAVFYSLTEDTAVQRIHSNVDADKEAAVERWGFSGLGWVVDVINRYYREIKILEDIHELMSEYNLISNEIDDNYRENVVQHRTFVTLKKIFEEVT
jgi:hypothetical protein